MLTSNCSFSHFLKKMLQIIYSLVLQPFCTSECLFPQDPPILGGLVYFRAKVFNDLFNFKIKNSSVSPSSSVIRLSIPPCQLSAIFPVFQFFPWNTVILSLHFGLFDKHSINWLFQGKSDTSVLKYFRLKIKESLWRRLYQISLPFIARF